MFKISASMVFLSLTMLEIIVLGLRPAVGEMVFPVLKRCGVILLFLAAFYSVSLSIKDIDRMVTVL